MVPATLATVPLAQPSVETLATTCRAFLTPFVLTTTATTAMLLSMLRVCPLALTSELFAPTTTFRLPELRTITIPTLISSTDIVPFTTLSAAVDAVLTRPPLSFTFVARTLTFQQPTALRVSKVSAAIVLAPFVLCAMFIATTPPIR